MEDGSLMKKDKPSLKTGSVPSIFPIVVKNNPAKSKDIAYAYTRENSAESEQRTISSF